MNKMKYFVYISNKIELLYKYYTYYTKITPY